MIKTLAPDKDIKRKLGVLYKQTAIDTRYTVVKSFAENDVFSFDKNNSDNFGTSDRMRIYEKEALPLAKKAVKDSGLKQKDLEKVTHLITYSCTGMYAPGLDIDLVKALPLPSRVQRFAINFMGCYAGITVMKLADSLIRANPNAKVLTVGVELCSIHFQKGLEDDFLLSNALFADGAAVCFHQSQSEEGANLLIDDFFCDIINDSEDDMAWHIRDFGFEMKLSAYVPGLLNGKIEKLFEKINLHKATLKNDYKFALHPGGKRIVDSFSDQMDVPKERLAPSYRVLKDFGNMSSVTVIFVLKELLSTLGKDDDHSKILSMAFGPGLSLESAFLRYVHI